MKKFFAAMITASLIVSGGSIIDQSHRAEAADSVYKLRAATDFNQLMQHSTPIVEIISDGLRFPESLLPISGGLLISNFGSDTMNPRDDEFKGYVVYHFDGVTYPLIAAGQLQKPTAMAFKDNHLFVCDGDHIKVFKVEDLRKPIKTPPQIIAFSKDDTVVNALALDGNTLYVSITNTDRIYSIDVTDPARMERVKPKKLIDVPGPNGLTVRDGVMYIATIPHDYANFDASHVIYRINDLTDPTLETFVNVPGLYDGAALSDDGRELYVSDWNTASVTAIDTRTKKRRLIYHAIGTGPADIAFAKGRVYIPDLPNSRVISIKVSQ